MVEAFGGSLNLELFILTLIGGGYYSYRWFLPAKSLYINTALVMMQSL